MRNGVRGKIAFYHARIPVDEGAGQSAKGDLFRVFHWSAPSLNVGDEIYRACDTPDHAVRPTFRAKYGIGAGLAVRPGIDQPPLSRTHNIVPPLCPSAQPIKSASCKRSGSRPGVAERGDEGFRRW